MSRIADAKPKARSHVQQGSATPNSATAAELFVVAGDPASASAAGSGPRSGIDKRRIKRQRVLKMAELVFDLPGAPIGCQVLDESRFGVMLETQSLAHVPERMKICFVGGPTFAALRRWANGNKIGLEFIGLFLEDDLTIGQVRSVRNVLKEVGVHAAVQMLRDHEFFQSSQLRSAAEEAEIAIARLESALS